jgi:5-formyltetrahydrofolate cyclo-ligase
VTPAGAARDLREAKQAIRRDMWDRLTAAAVVGFPGAKGRIPNFVGAGEAAQRLAEHPAWRAGAALKANPDMPQLPVRAAALAAGIRVYMAVPRLARDPPFLLLNPDALADEGVSARAAATIRGSSRHGVPVAVRDLEHLDLIVCGSVAVNREGVRIGKGGGYSDLEFALARELGLVDERTVIATTVHPLQVLDAALPETGHDFRVDLVVTPDEVVAVPGAAAHRPEGVSRRDLTPEKISAIPVLAARFGALPRG